MKSCLANSVFYSIFYSLRKSFGLAWVPFKKLDMASPFRFSVFSSVLMSLIILSPVLGPIPAGQAQTSLSPAATSASASSSSAPSLATSSSQAADPQLQIRLGEGTLRKSLVAVQPLQFFGNPSVFPQYQKWGAELYQVIQNDLAFSTYFDVRAFPEDSPRTSLRPQPTDVGGFNFDKWKMAGMDYLIRGGFSATKKDLTFEVYAYAVEGRQLVLGRKYTGPYSEIRKLAHTFANELLKELSGKEGFFLSRIVVSTDREVAPKKEIYVMDWDGANPEQVTQHQSVAFSPTWTSDPDLIGYSAFIKRAKTKTPNTDLLLYNLKTRKRWMISYRKGMNSGASFEPDGKHLLVTMSYEGDANIYRLDLEGKKIDTLVKGPLGALNVEPAANPDGTKFAFVSDKLGFPMVYTARRDGSGVESEVKGEVRGKFFASPAWSPDGKKLAFSAQVDDNFDIYVKHMDSGRIDRITKAKRYDGKAANNEDPTFSPDGRLIMYTSNRTGKNQIYVSDLKAENEWPITSDNHNYFKPKWSKNLSP